jgi:hypothetical protein
MSAPRALPKRIWAPALVLLLVSGIVSSLIGAEQPLVQTRTSYGGPPYAWGAAYDLLQELGLGPTRARARLAERDPAQTQWIVEPAWSERDLPYELASIDEFAGAGGTVVLLGADHSVWQALSLFLVREPEEPSNLGSREHVDGGIEPDAGPRNAAIGTQAQAPLAQLELVAKMEGPWLRGPRRIELSRSGLFDLQAGAAGEPRVFTRQGAFVIERRVGAGKIVAIPEARFLTNEQLAKYQHAAFLVDLALAYGAPAFDERCHGLTLERSPWAALGAGFLLLAALALTALTAAALQRARRWPARARTDDAPPAPTLEVFVSSLANLYRARGRSAPASVFRAYRLGFLRRRERALFGPRELSQARFDAHIEHELQRLGPAARWLSSAAAPSSRAELTKAVAALERYAASATSTKRKR